MFLFSDQIHGNNLSLFYKSVKNQICVFYAIQENTLRTLNFAKLIFGNFVIYHLWIFREDIISRILSYKTFAIINFRDLSKKILLVKNISENRILIILKQLYIVKHSNTELYMNCLFYNSKS